MTSEKVVQATNGWSRLGVNLGMLFGGAVLTLGIERNSLSLRQLVQPGCQNAFSGAVSGMRPILCYVPSQT